MITKFQKTEKYLMLVSLIALSFAACKKYNSIGYTPGTGAPVITSVSTLSRMVVDTLVTVVTTYDTSGNVSTTVDSNKTHQSYIPLDSTTATGNKQQYYVIHGQNLGSATTVLFNGVSAYFNRAYGTDKTLIVSIPLSIPTLGDSAINKLSVITTHGKASFNFTTLTPPPTIAVISDYDFWEGSQITLSGVGFASITAVGISGTNATATIVSQTDGQITLKFPAVSVTSANLVFSYSSAGKTVMLTTKQVFNDLDNAYTIFFKNVFQNGWQDASWQGPSGVSTDASHSGSASEKLTYPAGNWAVEGFAAWNAPNFPYDASYKYFSFWIKGGTVDHKLYLVTDEMGKGYGNGNTSPTVAEIVDVPASVWTFCKIPLAAPSSTNGNLLNPWQNGSPLKQIGFFLQGQDGDVNETMYLDEIAFLK